MRYKICTGFFIKPGNKREGVGSVFEEGGKLGSCPAQKKKIIEIFIQVAWIGSNIQGNIIHLFSVY